MSPEIHSSSGLSDTLVILGAAGIVIPTFARFRISPVIGFILAGIIVGPSGLGAMTKDFPWLEYATISRPEAIAPFAELGIILLLFSIGLELSFKRLWSMRRLVFGVGAGMMFIVTLVGIQNRVDPRDLGSATSANNFCRSLGNAFGKIGTELIEGDLQGAWQTAIATMGKLWADFSAGIVGLMSKAMQGVLDLWQQTVNKIASGLLKMSAEGGIMGRIANLFVGADVARAQLLIARQDDALGDLGRRPAAAPVGRATVVAS
mgnify:CR=1 FL=1